MIEPAPSLDESRKPPAVSVVIPTYNRREQLVRVVDALAGQRDDDLFEVVVVSDGSSDGTDDYLRSGTTAMPVHAVFQANAGPASARNAGVNAARGDLIVFIDDDVVAQPGLVEAHRRAHEDRPEIVVIGPMLTPPDVELSPWVAWEQAMLDKQYVVLERVRNAHYRNFYTGNASLERRSFLDAGGFDPKFRRAEDVELAYRLRVAGSDFLYCPSARSLHYAERSFESWIRNAYEYGRNDVIFVREGQAEILDAIVINFRDRHLLQRHVVLRTLGRPRRSRFAATALQTTARLSHRLRLSRVTRQALSGLYGLRYHEGVADEMGGPEALLALLAADGLPSERRAAPV